MTAVLDSLQQGRQAILPAMRAALDRLDPTSRSIAYYHLGWTDLDGNPTSGGGKAVRPALALLSAEAAGAQPAVGLPGAVAVELVHNFSLLHDDLMDGDTERRHRPTVWAVRGAASAILTGDAMLSLAQEVLLDVDGPCAVAAARLLAEATNELIRGQVLDVAFEQRNDVGLDECLDMAAGKTGALLSASTAIGAVLAGADRATVDALAGFGADLGLAFQLVDDVLGIWGETAVTGKPVYSDLRARKKSLPVTYAITHGGGLGREVAEWLARTEPPGEESVRRAAELIEQAGGRKWALDEAYRRMAAGRRKLEDARIPDHAREELLSLAQFIVTREA
ncbi:polyprenyl synthetase family protein [Amycolatopsis acidiphila]|uniref:Polyprenyl synthetase family protein n=1 Tax=Amycolatopsis acidiphila TaxID=715473 RepID=A0A558A400_9PSEU|nr:polyprenyl synthetase family protein [Amycolatopsis acidiphila]TVT18983.1 polyprenyl synthetase family protein [Amycolatopsis acidiphila]UIJ56670.1 polyprenyl synthetase family protein [Amycolatopsis acidiphila]GHG55883.1 (2E,6E)-farnesyl diphosphate synthase [Amycolatopsis acidiphila]